jgi:transposase
MRMWCGIDWAQRHHDIAVVDDDGVLVLKRRIEDSAVGFRQLLELLAEQTQRSEAPIPIAMETAKGLLPAALGAAGYQLFPINPLAVSRYRDRYVVSRAKSDPGDALVLANILRTDLAAHRPLPADSELVLSIRVLARAQQDAVWERQQAANKLRSLLHEYYPTFLSTFADLASSDARATLAIAPTPQQPRNCAAPRYGLRWCAPGATATSTTSSIESWRGYAASSSPSLTWWNKRWVARLWPISTR